MNPRDLPVVTTSAQMRAIDELAIKKYGVPSLSLMENAGAGIARRISESILDRDVSGKKIAILCGPGSNGGDGFVIARHLAAVGARLEIFSVVSMTQLKGDARVNAERATSQGLSHTVIGECTPTPDFSGYRLIIDALFGTGFRGAIEGAVARLIRDANESGIPIVSVDAPSGLDCDTGQLTDPSVRATYTITLGSSKLGHWLWPGRSAVGELEVIDIGIPPEATHQIDPRLFLLTSEFVSESLPTRPPDGHKGVFGKVLIIGGSAGLSGAVVLAANACMRSGVGLTYAAVPESLVDVVDSGSIETVTRSLPEVGGKKVLARRALGECLRLSRDVDAIAIGPGLSTHFESQELVRRLVGRIEKPTVIDADGLNACAKDPSCFGTERNAALVLTPHVGEMARLLGKTIEEIGRDRRAAAVEAAKRFNCVIVMKGAPTFVAEPEGYVYLNPTGNSGMASGGVGDVLTGIIVSLLAQGCSPLVAALCGAYLHGLAGDIGAEALGERALIASDIVGALPEALQLLNR